MRTAAIAILVAVASALVAPPAEAHGRARIGIGFHFGGPWWHPWWYPPPYYYYPPAVVYVPSQPTTYIEQSPPARQQQQDQTGWWYYCETSRGYYPYVKECPAGWQRVPPAPADAK